MAEGSLNPVCEAPPLAETPAPASDVSTRGDPRAIIGADASAVAEVALPPPEEACFPDSYAPMSESSPLSAAIEGRPLPDVPVWADPPASTGTVTERQRSVREQEELEASRRRTANSKDPEIIARIEEERRLRDEGWTRMEAVSQRIDEWALGRMFAPFEQCTSTPNDGLGDFGEETNVCTSEPEQRIVTDEEFARYATEPWTVPEAPASPSYVRPNLSLSAPPPIECFSQARYTRIVDISLGNGAIAEPIVVAPGESVLISVDGFNRYLAVGGIINGQPQIELYGAEQVATTSQADPTVKIDVYEHQWMNENAGIQYINDFAIWREGTELVFRPTSSLEAAAAEIETPRGTDCAKPGEDLSLKFRGGYTEYVERYYNGKTYSFYFNEGDLGAVGRYIGSSGDAAMRELVDANPGQTSFSVRDGSVASATDIPSHQTFEVYVGQERYFFTVDQAGEVTGIKFLPEGSEPLEVPLTEGRLFTTDGRTTPFEMTDYGAVKFSPYRVSNGQVEVIKSSDAPVRYYDELSPSGDNDNDKKNDNDDDRPPMAGVSGGGFSLPTGARAGEASGGQQRVAGYEPARAGDVCWGPGLEPLAVGAGVSGEAGVRAGSGYYFRTFEGSSSSLSAGGIGGSGGVPGEVAESAVSAGNPRGAFAGSMASLGLGSLVGYCSGLSEVPVFGDLYNDVLNFGTSQYIGDWIGTGRSLSAVIRDPMVAVSVREAIGNFSALMHLVVTPYMEGTGMTQESMRDALTDGGAFVANMAIPMGSFTAAQSLGRAVIASLRAVGDDVAADFLTKLGTETIPLIGQVLIGVDIAAHSNTAVFAYGAAVAENVFRMDTVDYNWDVELAKRIYYSGDYDWCAIGNSVCIEVPAADNFATGAVLAAADDEDIESYKTQIRSEVSDYAAAVRASTTGLLFDAISMSLAGETQGYDGSAPAFIADGMQDVVEQRLQDIYLSYYPQAPVPPEVPLSHTSEGIVTDECDGGCVNPDAPTGPDGSDNYEERLAQYQVLLDYHNNVAVPQYESEKAQFDLVLEKLRANESLADIRAAVTDQSVFDNAVNFHLKQKFAEVEAFRIPWDAGNWTYNDNLQASLAGHDYHAAAIDVMSYHYTGGSSGVDVSFESAFTGLAEQVEERQSVMRMAYLLDVAEETNGYLVVPSYVFTESVRDAGLVMDIGAGQVAIDTEFSSAYAAVMAMGLQQACMG